MKPSTKRQIKNGLRLGGGIGGFFIAVMLVGVTLEGLHSDAPGHLRMWPNVAMAGGLLALAAVMLVLTARVWVMYLAGCFLFSIPKVVTAIASGRDFYSPHGPFSRLEAAELLFFFLVSLFLIYRISLSHAPNMLDRLVLTLYLVSFVPVAGGRFFVLGLWQVVGLAALFAAWYLSRKKQRRCRDNDMRTAE